MPTRLLLGTLTALILAGAVGTAFFYHRSEQHASRVATLERDLALARTEAAREHDRAEKLLAKANELDTHLGNAKTRTTATETKNSQLARELIATKSSLTEREQRQIALLAEIESLRQQIKTAEASTPTGIPASRVDLSGTTSETVTTTATASATVSAGPLPPSTAVVTHDAEPSTQAASTHSVDIAAYRERIGALEAQLTELLTRALSEPAPSAAPSSPAASEPTPTAQTAPPHQVVRVGAHDAFVVVDYGRDEGAAIGDELTLYRGTVVVARVQISDARPRFSIAQVLPAGLKRQLQPGDFVLIAK
ncbi:MAG: hypothetical protein HYV96_03770 [Opitutae bacterium]|nr:hypothetical protein [Opitutae bacterium]